MNLLFGRSLATDEEGEQRVGVLSAIPMLGLDALGSAAYGPEAALTLLIPLGAAGLRYTGPISALIIVLLFVVYFSYRQTIAAYPHGGGSYTVAKENLGTTAGLLAGRRHFGGRWRLDLGAAATPAMDTAPLPGDPDADYGG
jgi:amino acid transporter